jgi:hypothetical protein
MYRRVDNKKKLKMYNENIAIANLAKWDKKGNIMT